MKRAFLIVGLLVLPIFSFCQRNAYQGLFLYQFSKYIKWPEAYGNGNFVIEVIGDDEVYKSITEMVDVKKTTQGMAMQVKRIKKAEEVGTPHILYIQNEYSHALVAALNKIKTDPVLIVTDQPGLAEKGSIINFVEKDGKMRFELNQKRAESIGLKVAGSLTSLAIVI